MVASLLSISLMKQRLSLVAWFRFSQNFWLNSTFHPSIRALNDPSGCHRTNPDWPSIFSALVGLVWVQTWPGHNLWVEFLQFAVSWVIPVKQNGIGYWRFSSKVVQIVAQQLLSLDRRIHSGVQWVKTANPECPLPMSLMPLVHL